MKREKKRKSERRKEREKARSDAPRKTEERIGKRKIRDDNFPFFDNLSAQIWHEIAKKRKGNLTDPLYAYFSLSKLLDHLSIYARRVIMMNPSPIWIEDGIQEWLTLWLEFWRGGEIRRRKTLEGRLRMITKKFLKKLDNEFS